MCQRSYCWLPHFCVLQGKKGIPKKAAMQTSQSVYMEQAHGCPRTGAGKGLAVEMQTTCPSLQWLGCFPTSYLSKCEYCNVSIQEMQRKTSHHEVVRSPAETCLPRSRIHSWRGVNGPFIPSGVHVYHSNVDTRAMLTPSLLLLHFQAESKSPRGRRSGVAYPLT